MKEYRAFKSKCGEYALDSREPTLYGGNCWESLNSFTKEELHLLVNFVAQEEHEEEKKMKQLKGSISARFATIALLQVEASKNKSLREGLTKEVAALQSELTKLEERITE